MFKTMSRVSSAQVATMVAVTLSAVSTASPALISSSAPGASIFRKCTRLSAVEGPERNRWDIHVTHRRKGTG